MMDNIFKRKSSGIWYRKWQESEGEKPTVKSLGTKNKERALRLHHQLKDQKERETVGQSTPARVITALQLPLSEHLAGYLYEKEKEWKSEKHWQVTRDRIKKICTETEWKYIRNITASSFRQWRAKQDLSAKTLNDYLSMLNAFIKWMIESGYIKESPLACISNLKRNGHTFERLALSPTEFQGFIDSIKDTNKRLCYLTVCYTGFRRAEMEALEWGDIRLSSNVAYIAARASTTKNGKDVQNNRSPTS